jgi:hypothetical protein
VAFLPEDFVVPTLVAGPRFQIRPVTIHDVVRVYDAIIRSRGELIALFGTVAGWPPAQYTLEDCLIDIAWQQKEATLRRSFSFAVLSTDETDLLGVIHVRPPVKLGADAVIAYWVRSEVAMPGLEDELRDFVGEWVTSAWPFKKVHQPGREIAWSDWVALPPVP